MSRPKRILLVDDSDNDVQLIQLALSKRSGNHEVTVAHDGVDAVDFLWRRGPYEARLGTDPDVILLDLKMPRKNGFDVLSWWRVQHNLGAIRIVVLTTSEAIRDINEAYKLGAASFLVKPLNFNEFRTTIFAMYDFWRNNLRGEASREEKSAEPDGNGAGSR